jgi:1,5-anhydro-D-fructose reductase (1,5-anhydro-D-mannitol-forming)
MSEPAIKIGMLSRWHVHADEYARAVNDSPHARVHAVWDEDPARGARWAAELGVDCIADYGQLFDAVDAVIVTAPTERHAELIIAAARAGKHVFTEKVLAPRLADARRIAAAVRAASIHFAISFPRRTIAPLLYAKARIESGALGNVTLLRIRIAHDGALRNWLPEYFYDPVACGGGAMIDLGAHGMYLARWLLGTPRRITSLFTSVTARAVEDNAVSMIEFDNGAVAINETSFVSWGGAYSVEIDGTRGGLLMASPRDVRERHGDDKHWHDVGALPAPAPMPIPRWLDGIARNDDSDFGMGIDAACELSAMMEAAYRSHRERRTVAFDELER